MRGAVTRSQQKYDSLIRKLKAYREIEGLTQEEAAAEIGKDQSWVSRLEDFKIKPSFKDIIEYADVLNMEVSICGRFL